MVRELTLAKYLVTNQWRELLFKRSSGSLALIFLVAFPFVLYKYWIFLQEATESIAGLQGKYALSTLSILFFLNMVCWFLPVWSSQQLSSHLKTTKFFPLSFRSLYFVKYITFFLVPAAIFPSILSILSFYPVFHEANFLSAVLYSVAVIIFSISVDFALVNILNLRNGRFLLLVTLILITSGLMLFSTSLTDVAAGVNRLLTCFLSTFLFTQSVFLNLFTALCLILIATALSVGSFKLFWEQEIASNRSSRRVRNFRFFEDSRFFIRYGLLLRQDLKVQVRSSFGPYLSVFITIYYAYFLLVSSTDAYMSFNIFLGLIFIPQLQIFYNFFGFEKVSSIERYASFPIKPSELIKLKNLVAIMLSIIILVILLPVIYLKFSFVVAVGFSLKWCLLTMGYLVGGNLLSIYLPFSRRYSGGFPNQLLFSYSGLILITTCILIMIDSLSENSVIKANWINAGTLGIYALFYFISLRWNDRYLNIQWENIRKAVAR